MKNATMGGMLFSMLFLFLGLTASADAQELVHYWNFNENVPGSNENWQQPILANQGTGEITFTFTEAFSFTGTDLNGVNGEVNGGSFAPRGGTESGGEFANNGNYFTIANSTAGFENISFTYATRGTSSGFNTHTVLYSTNGVDFTELESRASNQTSTWEVFTYDLSAIAAANDNPDFQVRVVLDGATGESGNNRFDNIQITGTAIGGSEPAVTAPVQIIHNSADPAAQLVDVYVNGELTLESFAFRTATPFVDLPAGETLTITVAIAGDDISNGIDFENIILDENETYYVIARGVLDPGSFASNPDGVNTEFTLDVIPGALQASSDPSSIEFFLYHGATDVPAVDVIARDVATLATNLAYSDITSNLSVSEGLFFLDVNLAGTTTTTESLVLETIGAAGDAGIGLASGFLDPASNNNGEELELLVVLPTGETELLETEEEVKLDITDARAKGVDELVIVEGIVTRAKGDFTYIQDETAGITIRQTSGNFNSQVADGTITQGTRISISGITSEFASLLQINDDDLIEFEILEQGVALPDPAPVTLTDLAANGENFEAQLVSVSDVTLDPLDDTTFNPGTTYNITDDSDQSGAVSFRVPNAGDSDLDGTAIVTNFDFTGVVGQFDFSDPSAGYQLMGILETDITDIGGVMGPAANLQIIHNSPDPAVSSVDIYVNGEIFLEAVAFREATAFLEVPAGVDLDIEIAPEGAGIGNAVGPVTVNLAEGENYIAVASGVLDPGQFTNAAAFSLEIFNPAKLSADDPATVEVNVHHGSPDAPAVDIFLAQTGDTPAVTNLAYPDFTGYVPLDPVNETIGIAGTGGEVLVEFSAPLADLSLEGDALTVLATGFFDETNVTNGNEFGLLAVLSDGTSLLLAEPAGPVEVGSIAELRAQNPDGTTVFELTNEVFLTFNSTFRGRKVVTDATGGIVFDDNAGIITTSYSRNDGITGLQGTLSIFRGLLQFVPAEDPGPASSEGNEVFPVKRTIPELEFEGASGDTPAPTQGQLVLIENVTIAIPDGQPDTWANGVNYTIEDSNQNTFTLRTDRIIESILEEDEQTYIGTPVPVEPVDVIGYITQFEGTVQIVPRKLGDFQDPGAIASFNLTAPENGATIQVEGESTELVVVSWEAAVSEADVTYQWIATTPDLLFSIPLLSIPSDNAGQNTTLTVTKAFIDTVLESFGVGVGEDAVIKWSVVASDGENIQYPVDDFTVTFSRGVVTSNEDDLFTEQPREFELGQNFPNPFNPTTQITFTLPTASDVRLDVFNTLGQRVATIVNGQRSAGTHTVSFEASSLSSGMYLYRIQADNFSQVRKMMLIK